MRNSLGRLIASFVLITLSATTLASSLDCPPQGDDKTEKVQARNVLKNRDTLPTWEDFDSHVTLAAIVATGSDADRWSDAKAATITGYVIDVKPGGLETVNCHARDLADRDTHIEIALRPGAPKTERMIIEVTPRLRLLMAAQGVDWSTDKLEQVLPDRWINVTGWLFFDGAHANAAENTNPGNKHDWRATAWEIHPVTAMALVAPPSVTSRAGPSTH